MSNPFEVFAKQQQSTTDIINSMISQTNSLACGPSCQKTQEAERLQGLLYNAKQNLVTAPIQVNQAEQNYYTYTLGTSGYQKIRNEEGTADATTLCNNIQDTFNANIKTAKTLNDTYSSLYTNYEYVVELLQNYIDENKHIEKRVHTIHSDIVTNDRKTYYESQHLMNLRTWYVYLWWVYIALVLFFIVASIFWGGYRMRILYKLLLVLILAIYPFVAYSIFVCIMDLFAYFYSLIPSNIYKKL